MISFYATKLNSITICTIFYINGVYKCLNRRCGYLRKGNMARISLFSQYSLSILAHYLITFTASALRSPDPRLNIHAVHPCSDVTHGGTPNNTQDFRAIAISVKAAFMQSI